MIDPAEQSNRLSSLFKGWSTTSRKIDETIGKQSMMGDPCGLNPSLLQRFLRWGEQIACLRRKENDIISEIMDIERKHQSLRKDKKLRRIEPALDTPAPEEKPTKDRFWFWLLLFLFFFSKKREAPTPKNG